MEPGGTTAGDFTAKHWRPLLRRLFEHVLASTGALGTAEARYAIADAWAARIPSRTGNAGGIDTLAPLAVVEMIAVAAADPYPDGLAQLAEWLRVSPGYLPVVQAWAATEPGSDRAVRLDDLAREALRRMAAVDLEDFILPPTPN